MKTVKPENKVFGIKFKDLSPATSRSIISGLKACLNFQ